MRSDALEMMSISIEKRDLLVQEKISTMKTVAKEYEKRYRVLIMIKEERQGFT